MTTNSPESLDEALIRRGRIDQKIHIGCASREVATKLFTQIFCKTSDELLEDEVRRDEALIAELAEYFASHLLEYTFTPAGVQGYLIDHSIDPLKAVREAAAYFDELRAAKAKAKGFNVSVPEDGKAAAVPGPGNDDGPDGVQVHGEVPAAKTLSNDVHHVPDSTADVPAEETGV